MADQKISQLTESTTPDMDGDHFVIEDNSAGDNKKVKPENSILITQFGEETTPADGDLLLIEDVSNADAKKKVQQQNLIIQNIKESGGTTLALGAVGDGEYVKRSGTDLVGAAGAGASTLDDLTDADINSAAEGESLQYRGSAFINRPNDFQYHIHTASDGQTHWRMRGGAYYNGTSYIAYVSGAEGDADINVISIDHSTWQVTGPVTLETAISSAEPEDHCAPAVIVLQNQGGVDDGKILVAYEGDSGTGMEVWKSTTAESIGTSASDWSNTLNGWNDFIYPQLTEVSSDGDVYLFGRNSGAGEDLYYRKSTDGGSTWGTAVQILDYDAYAQVAYHGDEIHIISAYKDANNDHKDIYYIHSDDGGDTWKHADGTTKTLPITRANMDSVFTSDAAQETRDADIIVDASGNPYLLFVDDQRNGDNPNSLSILKYAYYSSGWQIESIAQNATFDDWTDNIEVYACFDWSDIGNVIYNAYNVEGQTEIARWERVDTDQWQMTNVLTGTSAYPGARTSGDNARPHYIQDGQSELPIVFAYVEGFDRTTNRMGTYSELRIPIGYQPVQRDAATVHGTRVVDPLSHMLHFEEHSADPPDPPEGEALMWLSDGTASGADGDLMMKITAGSTTKTITLVDFSAS